MLRGLAVVLYAHKRDSCWLGRSCGSIVPRLLACPSLWSGPVFFVSVDCMCKLHLAAASPDCAGAASHCAAALLMLVRQPSFRVDSVLLAALHVWVGGAHCVCLRDSACHCCVFLPPPVLWKIAIGMVCVCMVIVWVCVDEVGVESGNSSSALCGGVEVWLQSSPADPLAAACC